MENKYENKYLIETSIGLQDVDKLQNSTYFLNETNRYIKGEITLDELDKTISSYYESKPDVEKRSEEADKVSVRIAKIISEDSFTFSVGQLISIHKILFNEIMPSSGKLRTYNFSKKEWVLDGESVTYGDYRELEAILQYDFEQEKKFNYQNLSIDEIIDHLSIFISNLWQAHIFEEGNTRTTAVFLIKYLRKLGFKVTNDTFAKNAWYFRNALVRANYTNISAGVFETRSYLITFLRNLLLNEHNDLKNRELHVSFITKKENVTKESKVIELISKNKNIKATEIAKIVGVSERTIKSVFKKLEEDKLIKRVNGKKYGYWEVIDK